MAMFQPKAQPPARLDWGEPCPRAARRLASTSPRPVRRPALAATGDPSGAGLRRRSASPYRGPPGPRPPAGPGRAGRPGRPLRRRAPGDRDARGGPPARPDPVVRDRADVDRFLARAAEDSASPPRRALTERGQGAPPPCGASVRLPLHNNPGHREPSRATLPGPSLFSAD